MRILVADDDPQVRSALRLILEQDPAACLVGEVVDTESLLQQAALDQIDLVLLDWHLPGLHQPAHIFSFLRQNCPALKILALGANNQTRHLAVALGADAFVSKGEPPEELLNAINQCTGHTKHL